MTSLEEIKKVSDENRQKYDFNIRTAFFVTVAALQGTLGTTLKESEIENLYSIYFSGFNLGYIFRKEEEK